MKSKIILSLALTAFNLTANARTVRSWSDAELLKASDLVVIAKPIGVKDLDETNSLGWPQSKAFRPKFRGVETTFKVLNVLKGMSANKRIILHHYRSEIEWGSPPNGPDFISFTPNSAKKYLLYLIKDSAGQYAPATGQIDPGLSIKPSPESFKSGAKPEDFDAQTIEDIWNEIWKSGAPEVSEPKLEKLSEHQVLNEMAGKWNAMFGSDKLLISLETNRQVSVSGIKDGKAWEKHGEWQVVSDKLVLFLQEDDLPSFIFRQNGKIYIFNPWAATMMSEMRRLNSSPEQARTTAPPQAIRTANGKIRKAQVMEILSSIDKALVNHDAAAVVANFASNAVIAATVVENGEKDTIKNDVASYRKNLEAGFQGFDNYKVKRNEITIQVTPDRQKATSASTLVGTYLFDGNAKQAVTKESATFEVIDGKILLTRMYSKVKIK